MPTVCIDNGWYGNCPMDRSWCAHRFAPKDSTNESAHKDQWNKLPSWCPLVPLPEGHGRLGDLDKLEDAFIRYYLEQERNNNLVFAAVEIKQRIADMMGDWPTIVPAEGGTDDGQTDVQR